MEDVVYLTMQAQDRETDISASQSPVCRRAISDDMMTMLHEGPLPITLLSWNDKHCLWCTGMLTASSKNIGFATERQQRS